MNDVITFEIRGLDAVLRKMRALPAAVRLKAAKPAVRKAASMVQKAARRAAAAIDRPETPLKIADNIAVQFASKHFRRTGDVMFRVGVRGGAKAYGNTKQNRAKGRVGKHYSTGGSTYYWRFVEFGTSRSRARPFMRPALEQNVGRATDVFVAEFGRQLDKLLKKAT